MAKGKELIVGVEDVLLQGNQAEAGIGNKNMKFTKGQIPWNKGVKGIHLSPQTEFKKGEVAPTKGRKFPERKGNKHPCWKGGEETQTERKKVSKGKKLVNVG